jgi:hypothetical protein
LSDLGGSYFPRKHKDALDTFDEEKWRMDQRKQVSKDKESGWEVFQRWRDLREDGILDWEAVVSGLGEWNHDDKVIRFGRLVDCRGRRGVMMRLRYCSE